MPCNQYQGPYDSKEEEQRIHDEARQKLLDDATRAACTFGKLLESKLVLKDEHEWARNWYENHCQEDKKREDEQGG